jgi:hypothetical protein
MWLEFGVNIQLCLGDRDFNIVLDSKVLHSGFNSPEVQFIVISDKSDTV